MPSIRVRLDPQPERSILPTWLLQVRGKDRSVLRLFAGFTPHATDEYRLNSTPSQPFSPTRGLEDRHITSSEAGGRLLTFPIEILGNILKYIAGDKEALASLALVNPGCQQLARPYQFSTVCFDYRPKTWHLLAHLAKEGQERESNHGATLNPSIGAYIRRIQVKTDTRWVQERHELRVSDPEFWSLSNEERNRRLEDANRRYFDDYIPRVGHILRNESLPHLEYLEWEDSVVLDRTFFNSLVQSSIKHLRLSQVCVMEDFEVEVPLSGAWPLRSLDIEMELAQSGQWQNQPADDPQDDQVFEHQDLHSVSSSSQEEEEEEEVDFFRLSTSILRLCAPTLEVLKWRHNHDSLKPIPFDSGLTEFPRLRVFDLASSMKLEKRLVKALIKSPLSGLTINTETDAAISESLDEIGCMRSLEEFVWRSWNLQETASLDFLSSNTQLKSLAIGLPVSSVLLDKRVLPLLASSFCSLRSLYLCWADKSIPESSIMAISTISSLEQLKLSAVDPVSIDQWLINHVVMRTHLYRLRKLKKLGFTNDSYTPLHPALTEQDYYAIRIPHDGDYEAAQLRLDLDGDSLRAAINSLPDSFVWELSHRNRMLAEAEKYAAIMPNLEWAYFGQIPIGLKLQRDRIRAVHLWPRRDDCITALSEMFVHHTI